MLWYNISVNKKEEIIMKKNKKEFLKLYYEIKNKDEINNLYMYDCLRESGFDEDMAYDLLNILYNL